ASYVYLNEGLVDRFQFLLGDGLGPEAPFRGTGLDSRTVVSDAVRVRRDGRTLREGVAYTFGYNATSGIIELTPRSGIWNPNSLYTIDLNNRNEYVVTAPVATSLADGQRFTIGDEHGALATFEYDTGYVLTIPNSLTLVVPPQGGAPGGVTDGETFTLSDGVNTVTFEFDSNSAFTAGNQPVVFRQFPSPSTADAIVDAMVTAIQNSGLLLSPANAGNGRLHLGSTTSTSVDLAGAPSLAVTGVPG